MLVVVDTNVWVSALLNPRGFPARLLRAFLEGQFTPVVIPIAQPKFVKDGGNGDPLLKVPPASRGNRTGARLGSPREAGGT
jgi:hypothetical protein